ncbi:MAG TPA: alkaline phosphatase family protein [Acidimicrobiales bacterium]
MNRRSFLRGAAALGGLTSIGALSPVLADTRRTQRTASSEPEPLLSLPPAEAPIDTIVILMMENRSFDHYFGWLPLDEAYMEAGRSRYGTGFSVAGNNLQSYVAPDGKTYRTYHLGPQQPLDDPARGCGHPDPGHGWYEGRVQRDQGFLAHNTGNDIFAIGYFQATDLPVYTALVRAFTTFDHYHAAIMSSTYPNRLYLLSAQTDGLKDPPLPIQQLGFHWPCIMDRLTTAGVSWRNYAQDLPTAAFFGTRQLPNVRPLGAFLDDAAAATLPQVSFVDPGFMSGYRTDDHPLGDHRVAQAFVGTIFSAFHASPQWRRGAMFVTYDEWGGFFDHVPPPSVYDDRASTVDAENFGQLGFRVPMLLLSPYARPGFVDHRLYEHTSVLRFLEWRFLGAPPEGPGTADGRSRWWLTGRDRYANNIGASMVATPDTDARLDPASIIPDVSAACVGRTFQDVPVADQIEQMVIPQPKPDSPTTSSEFGVTGVSAMQRALEAGYFDRLGYQVKPSLTLAQLTGR